MKVMSPQSKQNYGLKKTLVGAFALSLVMSLAVNPQGAYAQLEGAESGSESAASEAPPEGAKGLFFQQLDRPTETINTGLRYWIELKRGHSVLRVTNKTQFRSGDSIRFHVKSNIDGYAYILLSQGSVNEKAVLFPDPASKENNRLERGKEYTLPESGYLTFDDNPGTEKLTLLLSRTPIDAEAYLSKPQRQVTMIASAQTGSKDLVPAKIYISYNTPRIDAPPVIRDEPKADPTPVPIKVSTEKKEKKPVAKTSGISRVNKVAKTSTSSAGSSSGSSSASGGRNSSSHAAGESAPKVNNAHHGDDEGTTTVVSKQASSVLHVNVVLDHQR